MEVDERKIRHAEAFVFDIGEFMKKFSIFPRHSFCAAFNGTAP
jgi:hypothetical protein